MSTRASGGQRRQILRAEIVERATELTRFQPGGEITIRGLARDLGFPPMSLYRHVRNRDDLLEEVVDRLLGEVWMPEVPETCWRSWTIEAADRLRQLLCNHPVALEVYLRRPVVTGNAILRMETMLRVLGVAGLAGDDLERAYSIIHTFTIGFAALAAARGADTAPPAGEVATKLASYTAPERFLEGLGFLLDGLTREAGGRGVHDREG